MSSVTLNNRKLVLSSIAGLAAIAGVVIKNSLEQAKMDMPIIEMAGKILFIGGWALTAYSISLKGTRISFSIKSMLAVIASAGVVVSVFMMKAAMKNGEMPNLALPITFMSSWILLGITVAIGGKMMGYVCGVGASLLVISSMMYILPKQREMGIVDGPGMPMFSLSWVLLAYVNSRIL